MEGGGATLGRDAIMDGRSTPCAGRFDGLGLVEKQMEMERKRRKDIREREILESQIEGMDMEEEDGIKRMPLSNIVKYHGRI